TKIPAEPISRSPSDARGDNIAPSPSVKRSPKTFVKTGGRLRSNTEKTTAGQPRSLRMNNHLWIFIDDRGLSRPILELWVPALNIDVIWTTGKTIEDEIDLNAEASPALELSPADIAALSSEFSDEQGH